MAGRGSRGAAILEYLKSKEALRRPGEAEQPQSSASSTVGATSAVSSSAASTSALSEPGPSGYPLAGRGARSLPGRGRSLLHALARDQLQQVPPAAPPGGARALEGPPTGQLAQLELGRGRQERREERKEVVTFAGGGDNSKPIQIVANQIPVVLRENRSIFEYSVKYNPEIDSRSTRFRLLKAQTEAIGNVNVFDGRMLFLPFRLPQQVTTFRGTNPNDGSEVQIILNLTAERKLHECVHLYNILMRRLMSAMELVQIGRHNYDPKGKVGIQHHNLEIWPGFITAIQQLESGLMLCAETSHRVIRTQTVLEILTEIHNRCSSRYRDEATKAILGSVVLTRYNNNTYRVDDIIWDQTPMSSFTKGDGSSVTYVEYYKQHYGIELKHRQQPLLLNRMKKRNPLGADVVKEICIIPELAHFTGLTEEMRKDFRMMKDISTHTRLNPDQRQTELVTFIRNLNASPKCKEILDSWGIDIRPELKRLDGRVFQEELITFRNGSKSARMDADWSRAACSNPVLVGVDLENWVVIHVNRNSGKVKDFIAMMMEVGLQLGISIKQPRTHSLPDDRNETLQRALKTALHPDLQIVVIVNPSSRDDRYSIIKKTLCCETPLPSQVINARTIDHPAKLRSVTQKIALQMNCKLGGELWRVNIPMKNIMVCGIDAYHDTTDRKNSVLGFVSSTSKELTRWHCDTAFQTSGQEVGTGMNMMMHTALLEFNKVNHCLPDKIFVFRDGVSDGQLEFVQNYEIEPMYAAFNDFKDYKPDVVFIVVQKRINTRLLFQGGHQLTNPPPGTIVDHSITRRSWPDFFLVSQYVRQGTVTPTHYIVAHNTTTLSPAQIQRLTYKMTHLYYNWPGTIRVPAPCQYAHKLAALVGESIHKQPNVKLRNRLFFL